MTADAESIASFWNLEAFEEPLLLDRFPPAPPRRLQSVPRVFCYDEIVSRLCPPSPRGSHHV
jgi:hypothetical protein